MEGRRQRFPSKLSRADKRSAGRTAAARTPLNVRTEGVELDPALQDYVLDRAGRKFGKFARHVERVTVRFEDANGPRGGVDLDCRVKMVLSGAPSIIVSKRAAEPRTAFDVAADAAERTLRRTVERRGWSEGSQKKKRRSKFRGRDAGEDTVALPAVPEGSLIGRRVGHATANLHRAAARPEKQRRDHPVDTSAPGVSATNRRAGGASTAARNTRLRAPKATALLEDSAQQRPSRKSTRRSSGRAKRDGPQRLANLNETSSPSAVARRAQRPQR
jgi:ribosome-associated translation inhibitor RaiA